MTMDDDLRQAVEDRLAAQRVDVRSRREARRRRLAELAERRKHGLKTRHRNKLARGETPHATGSGERTRRTNQANTHQRNKPAEHHGQRNTPTFRDWLLAHAAKRPRSSRGVFMYRLARDAARCHEWNTPDDLVKAMETLESGPGHGAPPMSAADRVLAAVMLYRARVGVDPRGVDGRPVMAPVDPADGHGTAASGTD